MKVLGELEQAQIENLEVAPTNTPSGLLYFDTTNTKPYVYSGRSGYGFSMGRR